MSLMHTIALARLNTAIRIFVRGFGSSAAEVEAVAGNLIEANLTGHDSHGIGMLPRYAEAYLQGGLKPNTHVRTVLDAGALLRLDGGAGFGQVIGQRSDGAGHRPRQGTRQLHRRAGQLRTTSAASAPGPSRPRARGWCRCTSST